MNLNSIPSRGKDVRNLFDNKLKLFAIFAIISLVVSSAGINAHAALNTNDSNPASAIKYQVKVGEQKYFLKINVCSEKTIAKPTILVQTDKELKKIKYEKIIFAGTCKSVETIAKAKYPSKITVELIGNSLA